MDVEPIHECGCGYQCFSMRAFTRHVRVAKHMTWTSSERGRYEMDDILFYLDALDSRLEASPRPTTPDAADHAEEGAEQDG